MPIERWNAGALSEGEGREEGGIERWNAAEPALAAVKKPGAPPVIPSLAQLEYEGLPLDPEARRKEELRRAAVGEVAQAPAVFPLPIPLPGMLAGVGPPAPELTEEMLEESVKRNLARIKKPFEEMSWEDIEQNASITISNLIKLDPVPWKTPIIDAVINTAYNFVVGFPLHMGAFIGGAATDIGEWMAGQGFDLDSARAAYEQISSITAATPFTEGGAQLLQASFGYLDDLAKKGGESAVDATGNAKVGAITYATLQILPYILGARLLRKGRKSERALTEEDVRLTMKDLKEESRPTPKPALEPKVEKVEPKPKARKVEIGEEEVVTVEEALTQQREAVTAKALAKEKVVPADSSRVLIRWDEVNRLAEEARVAREPAAPVEPTVVTPEAKPTAVFKTWQETGKGDHVALYNVKGGKLDRSTVSGETLKREGITVPETPEKPTVVAPPVEPAITLTQLNEDPGLYKSILDNRKLHTKEVVTRAEEIGARVLADIKQEGDIVRRYEKKESTRSIAKRHRITEEEVISILEEAEALRKIKPTSIETVMKAYRTEIREAMKIAEEQNLSPEQTRRLIQATHERVVDKYSDRTRYEYSDADADEINVRFDKALDVIEPTKRTAADVDASEAQRREVTRAADEVRGEPDVTLEFGGFESFRKAWKRSKKGEEIEQKLTREYGKTTAGADAMYMTRSGEYIKKPGEFKTHYGIDTYIYGDEHIYGATASMGRVARETGMLEVVPTKWRGKDNVNIRAYSRLSDQQVKELRRLSEVVDEMFLDVYNAEGVGSRGYTKENLHRFIAEARPTDVTLEFGGYEGFGKMYRDLVNSMKRRAVETKKPLSPEATEVLDRGEIVKHKTIKGRRRPPVFRAELEVLKGLKKLEQVLTHRGFENPIRTFEEAGGEAFLDMTIHPYHAREFAIARMSKAAKRSLRELRKEVGPRSRRRIMIYAVSKQKRGMQLLKHRGIKDVPELTPKEMEVYNALRERYKSWYVRLNRVRKAIGKEPFPEEKDYFTFIRTLSMMEETGFKPMHTRAATFSSQYVKAGATAFRFAKRRVGGKYKLKLDPFEVLEIYEKQAIRHIQLSPLIAKLRELQTVIKDPETGKSFRLGQSNPVLAVSLHSWVNHIAGLKSTGFELPPFFEKSMLRINSNLTAAILGANVRSAGIQVSALRNTITKVGFGYTLRGISSLIDPHARNLAMRKSKVLSTRKYDVTVEDALRSIRSGRLGELQRIGTAAALKPLQILDIETAKATWHAAYKYGMDEMDFGPKRAAVFADDIVTKTQASALPGDVAPVQRAVVGRFLTLFQTFTINDWNFLIRDVLGVRNATVDTPQAFANAIRLVAATTLFNILYEDVLHTQSPFPTPIRAFRESLERGDDTPSLVWNVAKEFIEPIPIIGAARYGKGPGGPGVELLNETIKYITRKPMAEPGWKLGGEWLGLPGTAQGAKWVRARKRGETLYGQIVGTYTPPRKRRGRATRGGLGRELGEELGGAPLGGGL